MSWLMLGMGVATLLIIVNVCRLNVWFSPPLAGWRYLRAQGIAVLFGWGVLWAFYSEPPLKWILIGVWAILTIVLGGVLVSWFATTPKPRWFEDSPES